MRVTLPMSLLSDKNVSSLKELRARQKDIQTNHEALGAVRQFQEVFESWHDFALRRDDTKDDHAAHQKGLVVVDNHTSSDLHGSQTVTGEWQAGQDGKIASSNFEITTSNNYSIRPARTAQLSYKRTEDKETYHEKVGGKQMKLVLDHKKGTLTFLDTVHEQAK